MSNRQKYELKIKSKNFFNSILAFIRELKKKILFFIFSSYFCLRSSFFNFLIYEKIFKILESGGLK